MADYRAFLANDIAPGVTGDGAAGFNIMELQTAAREGIETRGLADDGGAQRYGTTFGTAQGEIRRDLAVR